MGNDSEKGLENILGPGLREGWRESAIGLKPQKPLVKETCVCVYVCIQPGVTAQGNFSSLLEDPAFKVNDY